MPSFRVSVTRPLDLEQFTDRWALGSLFAFGGAGYFWGGWPEAVQSGLVAYLSWALSRELDPDHPLSANLAALAGGSLAWALQPDVGVLLVVLLVAKVMVGSSGLSPARWEAGVLGALAMVLAVTPTGWWAAVAMAAALFLDTLTPPHAPSAHRFVAGGVALGGTIVYLLLGEADHWWWAQVAAVAAAGLVLCYAKLDLYKRLRLTLLTAGIPALGTVVREITHGNWGGGPWWMYGLLVGGLAFGVALGFMRPEVASSTDRVPHLISSERVWMARLLMAALVIVAWASESDGALLRAVEPAACLWAVLILVGIRESWDRTGRRTGKKSS